MADLTLTSMAPQGKDSTNYNPNAPSGTAGSLDPTAGVVPTQGTTGSAYNLSSPASVGGRTLYDPATGNALANTLASSFEGSAPYQSILGSYGAAQARTSAQYQAAGEQIGTQYGQDIQQKQQENRVTLDNTMTGRSLATNTALLAQMQDQADYRIKNLRDQERAALASNNTEAAAKLADLAATEQSTITTARKNFLDNYFATQAESRAQATFQTPEQQAVLTLAGQYPQAGITPGDTLASAQTKVSGSAQYKLTQQATQAQITQAVAQAAAAGATAEQTKKITSLMGGAPNDNGDVTALLSHSMTPDQLRAKYANYPSGVGSAIAANIISAAQAQGYDVNVGTLTGQGQEAQTAALNSGNPFSMLGGWLSQAGAATANALGGAPRTYRSLTPGLGANAGQNPAAGVDGAAFGFPGYVSNGSAWVKKK